MKPNVTAIERAFELARSGQFSAVADLRRQLHVEGYATTQIVGRVMMRQLRSLLDQHYRAPSEG